MNTHELIVQLSTRLEKPQEEIRSVLKEVIGRLRKALAHEQSFTMQNFGSFSIQKRDKRKAFHPIAKRYMLLPPKLFLRFKMAKALRERFKGGGV